MWRDILTREEDLPDGTVDWRLSPDESEPIFTRPLVDWDVAELNKIAAKMKVKKKKIIKI